MTMSSETPSPTATPEANPPVTLLIPSPLVGIGPESRAADYTSLNEVKSTPKISARQMSINAAKRVFLNPTLLNQLHAEHLAARRSIAQKAGRRR